MLRLVLLSFACAPSSKEDTAATADTAVATDADTGGAAASMVDELFARMAGDFDSSAQAQTDPSYYAISLRMCAVELEALGQRVLYVEQASMSSLSSPYRQRLYVLEDAAQTDEAAYVSRVYAPNDEHLYSLVGLCDSPADFDLDMNDIYERTGCEVWLDWDGEDFSGGTSGSDCESSLNGAAYATSEVTVGTGSITSWDRGWFSNDQQAWGATAGAYVFERVSGSDQ